jgi:hypothetical protein
LPARKAALTKAKEERKKKDDSGDPPSFKDDASYNTAKVLLDESYDASAKLAAMTAVDLEKLRKEGEDRSAVMEDEFEAVMEKEFEDVATLVMGE